MVNNKSVFLWKDTQTEACSGSGHAWGTVSNHRKGGPAEVTETSARCNFRSFLFTCGQNFYEVSSHQTMQSTALHCINTPPKWAQSLQPCITVKWDHYYLFYWHRCPELHHTDPLTILGAQKKKKKREIIEKKKKTVTHMQTRTIPYAEPQHPVCLRCEVCEA